MMNRYRNLKCLEPCLQATTIFCRAALVVITLSIVPACAADKQAIALTVMNSDSLPRIQRRLVESVAELLEANLLTDGRFAVVERRRIDAALRELVLSRSRSEQETLQLGKLMSADLLMMLEALEPTSSKATQTITALRLQIVEAKTGAIRGVMAISELGETNVDDVADDLARFATSNGSGPKSRLTLAVAPFESVGRFDRLRPLELGLRDLVTARLLALCSPVAPGQESRTSDKSRSLDDREAGPSNASADSDSAILSRSDKATSGGNTTFHVLQRSNLEHLLRELDLVRSGFANSDKLPVAMPTREAAYLIRGEINEQQAGGPFEIVVRVELIHAATGKARDRFEFTSSPADLESKLNQQVDELIGRLDRQTVAIDRASRVAGWESSSLKESALRDLHRFRRQCPIDHSHRAFAMPGEAWLRGVPRLVEPGTPLGKALLRKSIDRLETVLFIHPDDAEAAYALGFCLSIHQSGIFQPDRADELFRKAADLKPATQLAAYSLTLLSELSFDDESGQLTLPKSEDQTTSEPDARAFRLVIEQARHRAAERVWFALENIPEPFRDHRHARMLELFLKLNLPLDRFADFFDKAIRFAEQADAKHRATLAGGVKQMAQHLFGRSRQQPELRGRAIEGLRRWADSPLPELAVIGRDGSGALYELNGEHWQAAQQYEAGAAFLADGTTIQDRIKWQMQLLKAAKNYRLAKDPRRAMQVLNSFEPIAPTTTLIPGMHSYEQAACHEALGDPKLALTTYWQAAEKSPNLSANSDLVDRINALGGVPLREDREIDVKYITREDQRELRTTALATDGQRLFLGGVVPAPRSAAINKLRFFGGIGVAAFDPESGTWESLNTDLLVTSLKLHGRELWIGTVDRGLWRFNLDSRQWRSFGMTEGLPDLRVESIAFRGGDLFAGVGSQAAGGLVRIDESGTVHLFDGPDAPTAAPTDLIVTEKELLARTLRTVHRWSWETATWTQQLNGTRLFEGTSGLWASCPGHELTRWEADAETNQRFQAAWYRDYGKAGYPVNFVTERGDDIWFGGQQWELFTSSGLYRLNMKTGSFTKFTPADGFKTIHAHSIFTGLWLHDRLWLGTSSGLCVVTPRSAVSEQPKQRFQSQD